MNFFFCIMGKKMKNVQFSLAITYMDTPRQYSMDFTCWTLYYFYVSIIIKNNIIDPKKKMDEYHLFFCLFKSFFYGAHCIMLWWLALLFIIVCSLSMFLIRESKFVNLKLYDSIHFESFWDYCYFYNYYLDILTTTFYWFLINQFTWLFNVATFTILQIII